MEAKYGYTWYAAYRVWTKWRPCCSGIMIKEGILCEEMTDKIEVCFAKKYGESEWLV